jgi:hypothetical protein
MKTSSGFLKRQLSQSKCAVDNSKAKLFRLAPKCIDSSLKRQIEALVQKID